MSIILFLISLPCVQLVGIVVRLFPFWTGIESIKKRNLFIGYGVLFLIEMILLYFVLPTNMDLTAYKAIVNFGAILAFFVECIVIRKEFYARLFILSVQATICFLLHSVPSLLLNILFGEVMNIYLLTLQSYLTVLVFIIFMYPLYKLFKRQIRAFQLLIQDGYYWNVIWMVPAAIYFNILILTLNPRWINFREFLVRLIATVSIYVIFRCITLDYLKHQEWERTKNDNRLLLSQAQAMADSLTITQETETKLSRFRHDFRHHIRTLGVLLEDKDYMIL